MVRFYNFKIYVKKYYYIIRFYNCHLFTINLKEDMMTTVATCHFLAIIMVTCHFGNKIYIKINNNNNSNKTILKIQVNLTINFIKYNKFNKLIYLLLIIWFICYSYINLIGFCWQKTVVFISLLTKLYL